MPKPPDLRVTIGSERFAAHLRNEAAPVTCAWLLAQLPYRARLIHARWSGEACWTPLGEPPGLPHEDASSHPAPGEVLVYGGGLSEPEMLIAYGPTRFASKAGPLAGNPVMSIFEARERLAAVGRRILQEGALALKITHWHAGDTAQEPMR